MTEHAWVKEFPGAIVVCDPEGIILYMNDRAIKSFEKQGGKDLIGTNVLDCHPEAAREKLKGLMDRQEDNVYSIEKEGQHRLIYQTPWYQEGRYAGFVEIVFPVPAEIPHFIRKS
ncbi:MAG: diguanylate cyclase [Deltaproteobacteria bacterium]|nr:diguanylate cyclase [Deltaproteobacteria bacterium]